MSALIDATRVREHLEALGAAGMGKRAVAKASGVALSLISGVKAGRRKQIRTADAVRLLAVGVAS